MDHFLYKKCGSVFYSYRGGRCGLAPPLGRNRAV